MRDRYAVEGIDLRHVEHVQGEPSGVALIMVGDDGENLIGVSMGANARLTPESIDDLPAELFEAPGVFLASLEVPIETVIRAIRRARLGGMTVILNPAPASAELAARGVLDGADILTPNQTEAEILTGESYHGLAKSDLVENFEEFGWKTVVLTLAEEGCLVVDGSDLKLISAHEVAAIDTVGAGDAFNGALAAALAEGLSLVEAATRANAAGAIAVTKHGAQGALPTRDEIDRMVASRPTP